MTDAAPLFDDLAQGPPGGRAIWCRTEDGLRIRAAIWPQGSSGTVLLFPGRTEYVEKYGPAAAELARRGFATVVIDWRGQGLSDRVVPQPMIGHVKHFSDYQRDLRAVLAALEGLGLPEPRFLLSHSMGGTIALRSLLEDVEVRAAAFTAPMWNIRITRAMRPLAWALASGARAAGLGLTLAPGTDPTSYVLVAPYQGNVLTTDAEMFAWMKAHMIAHPELSLGGPSMHWLHEALVECRRLHGARSPQVPGLVLLGSAEKVVDTDVIRDRMRRWPSARLEVFAGAEHEVLMESAAMREHAYDMIAAFFDTHRQVAPHRRA